MYICSWLYKSTAVGSTYTQVLTITFAVALDKNVTLDTVVKWENLSPQFFRAHLSGISGSAPKSGSLNLHMSIKKQCTQRNDVSSDPMRCVILLTKEKKCIRSVLKGLYGSCHSDKTLTEGHDLVSIL